MWYPNIDTKTFIKLQDHDLGRFCGLSGGSREGSMQDLAGTKARGLAAVALKSPLARFFQRIRSSVREQLTANFY